MSYDEQPAWVWRGGNSYIRLPARAVDTEWLIRFRFYAYAFHGYAQDVALGRKRVPARATREVIMTWCRGMEWCAQERPAPERRSGKDRRKPTVAFFSPIAAPEPVVTRTDWAGGAGEAR